MTDLWRMNEYGRLSDLTDDMIDGQPTRPPMTQQELDAAQEEVWRHWNERERAVIEALMSCLRAGSQLSDVAFIAAELGLTEEFNQYRSANENE